MYMYTYMCVCMLVGMKARALCFCSIHVNRQTYAYNVPPWILCGPAFARQHRSIQPPAVQMKQRNNMLHTTYTQKKEQLWITSVHGVHKVLQPYIPDCCKTGIKATALPERFVWTRVSETNFENDFEHLRMRNVHDRLFVFAVQSSLCIIR